MSKNTDISKGGPSRGFQIFTKIGEKFTKILDMALNPQFLAEHQVSYHFGKLWPYCCRAFSQALRAAGWALPNFIPFQSEAWPPEGLRPPSQPKSSLQSSRSLEPWRTEMAPERSLGYQDIPLSFNPSRYHLSVISGISQILGGQEGFLRGILVFRTSILMPGTISPLVSPSASEDVI